MARLLPAIARQATLKVVGPPSAVTTARVVASALQRSGFEAETVMVEVQAFTAAAWAAGEDGTRKGERAEYPVVTTAGVLIDACLDLLSVPGGSLTLRPSWFGLPPSWDDPGRVAFRHELSGAVVSYDRGPRWGFGDDADAEAPPIVVARLSDEVVDLCRQAEQVFGGAEAAPSRWEAMKG